MSRVIQEEKFGRWLKRFLPRLAGGIMACGLAAGSRHSDQGMKSKYAMDLVGKYWAWWLERASLNCGEIRPNCFGEGYPRMYNRAAAKIEEILAKAAAKE